ncbi:unnamed protein product [Effrenium voratum]|uniref:Uncharacterized protein n=1 Tax=Effrenium voratum TaxID=2562239 RepID=A0AA36N782_9DINO|nr:unnamed protein product [Effrenium voratum]
MRAVWRLRATACIRCKRRSGTERLTRSHSGKDAIALRLSLSSPEARGDAGLASDTIHPELDHMPAYAILSHIACQSGQFGGAVVGAFPQTEDAVPCAYVTQLPDVNRIDLPWRRDAIMDELQDDPVRVARMRRDLDIPQFSQAGRIILKSLAVEAFPHADDAALEKLFYGSAVVRDNIGAFLDVDALKHLSMKILYYKKEHAFNGVTDLLAPIAHVQLTGRKLLLGAPLASIIAAFTVSESNTGVAMTVANLVKHMVGMTAKDFVSAGGFWVILNPGSLAVTPSSCLIMEYGVDDMGSTLSWPAFMRGHCDPSEIATVRADISQLLQNCCHATDKLSETHFTVADRFYVCVTELASASNVKTEQAQVLMPSTLRQTSCLLPESPSPSSPRPSHRCRRTSCLISSPCQSLLFESPSVLSLSPRRESLLFKSPSVLSLSPRRQSLLFESPSVLSLSPRRQSSSRAPAFWACQSLLFESPSVLSLSPRRESLLFKSPSVLSLSPRRQSLLFESPSVLSLSPRRQSLLFKSPSVLGLSRPSQSLLFESPSVLSLSPRRESLLFKSPSVLSLSPRRQSLLFESPSVLSLSPRRQSLLFKSPSVLGLSRPSQSLLFESPSVLSLSRPSQSLLFESPSVLSLSRPSSPLRMHRPT